MWSRNFFIIIFYEVVTVRMMDSTISTFGTLGYKTCGKCICYIERCSSVKEKLKFRFFYKHPEHSDFLFSDRILVNPTVKCFCPVFLTVSFPCVSFPVHWTYGLPRVVPWQCTTHDCKMQDTAFDFVGSNSTPKFYIPLSNFCSGFSRCLQSCCAHKAISQALCWSTQEQSDSTVIYCSLLSVCECMPMISFLHFNAKNLAVNIHIYYIRIYNLMCENVYFWIFS